MSLLHIVNTNFEWELDQNKKSTLEQSIDQHAISLQLQFLPLLYAERGSSIGVTHLPSPDYPSSHPFHLLSSIKSNSYDAIEEWGHTQSLLNWASKHQIKYTMPSLEVVRSVNSKVFSFQNSPRLEDAALLHSKAEVMQWIASTSKPKVLKRCFGFAGRGHLFLPCAEKILNEFAEQEFTKNLPIIGEPWVERAVDFSTQWLIHQNRSIHYLGHTLCLSNSKGQYQGTIVGSKFPIKPIFLDQHKEIALELLHQMKEFGYYGHVGFDAMIYNKNRLHPIVEINARKTMGFVALKIQQTRFPKQAITVSYQQTSGNANLLPDKVFKADGSPLYFKKQLIINLITC